MRRRTKVGLSVLAAALLAGVLGFSPLVRARASAQAAKRGAELEIGAVRPGWGRVWLRDVRVRLPDVPAVEVRLDALEVRVSSSLGAKAVYAHGGELVIRGEPSEVLRQVAEWRSKRPASEERGGGAEYAVDGLAVTWYDARAGAEPERVWGAHYERHGASEQLTLDLARAELGGINLEAQKVGAQIGRRDGKRVLERLVADSVSGAVDLDSGLVRDALERRAPPSERPTLPERAAPGAPPRLGFDTAHWIDEGRGARARAAFTRAAEVLRDVLPESGELDLAGLRLGLRRHGESLSIGPARLRVVRGADAVSLALMPAPDATQALRLSLELPFEDKDVKGSIEGGPVSLAALGIMEGNFGLRDVAKATLEARGNAVLASDGRTLTWVGGAKVSGLSLERKWLAPGPVRGISVGLDGKAEIQLDGTHARIDKGELQLGKLRFELDGELSQTREYQRIQLAGGAPLASCQALLDAAPDGLAPLLSGMRMSGTFSFNGKLDVDTRHLENMLARWNLVNECRITETPADVSLRKFAQSWSREVLDADGRPTLIQSGPGTLGWVPRAGISKHMETAVLICEDGAFLRHRGFDEEAIRNSIRENVKAGRFIRGASTISMQLAKNLYLPRDKTLSRKLQEAVLTLLLEQELTKDQILELYLNVIEFGPGIYGIGPAAAYYFNSSASQLSLGQALYLASILPNPKKQYFGADGAVIPGWSAYLRKLMHIAAKIHRVNEEELKDALAEQVTFKTPYSPRVPGPDDGPEAADGVPSPAPDANAGD